MTLTCTVARRSRPDISASRDRYDGVPRLSVVPPIVRNRFSVAPGVLECARRDLVVVGGEKGVLSGLNAGNGPKRFIIASWVPSAAWRSLLEVSACNALGKSTEYSPRGSRYRKRVILHKDQRGARKRWASISRRLPGAKNGGLNELLRCGERKYQRTSKTRIPPSKSNFSRIAGRQTSGMNLRLHPRVELRQASSMVL